MRKTFSARKIRKNKSSTDYFFNKMKTTMNFTQY